MNITRAAATISEDGQYRYDLFRYWGENDTIPHQATFVMLNPSTADADYDDPTIRRCVGFATREGCDALRVVNLYGLRSTDPAWLRRVTDPVGPQNDDFIRRAVRDTVVHNAPLIVAWGANARPDRVEAFRRIVSEEHASPRALALTKVGHPGHPLYLKSDSPLIEWR